MLFFLLSLSAGETKGIEDMDMNAVRLCFQCELEYEDGRKDSLSPVVSSPIYDKSKTLPDTQKRFPLNVTIRTKKVLSDSQMLNVCLFYSFTEATTTSQLKITCLNLYRGSCTGKTEIYMLCDKVQKGTADRFLFLVVDSLTVKRQMENMGKYSKLKFL